MNFEENINLLTVFLQKKGFLISDKVKNYIQYDSKNVRVVFSYDEREDTFAVYIGKKDDYPVLLTEEILVNVFKENNYFIPGKSESENLLQFFKNNGKHILNGDKVTLNHLEEYADQSANEYTDNINRNQQIAIADEAWSKKDYLKFIGAFEQIERTSLTNSYLLKYEFAKKKLKS